MRNSKGVTSRALWIAGLLAAVLTAGIVAITQIAGATPNPPGNNGTIKIDKMPFDDLPNNEPHVGCTFQVDFYGYDKGNLFADVTFEAHEPTLRPGDDQVLLTDKVFIGEDDNSGGGSQAGLDASKTYTLDFTGITPHPIQGFHVKLTIHADGSKGADTKHKVFWVTGCEVASTTTTTAPTTTIAPTTTTTPTTTIAPTTTTTPTTTIAPTTTTPATSIGATTTTGGQTTTTIAQTTTTAAQTTTTVKQTTTTVGETTTTHAPETTQTTLAPSTTHRQETTTTAAAGLLPASSSGRGGLPSTGANFLPMVATGLLLFVVGAAGVLASRRMRAR